MAALVMLLTPAVLLALAALVLQSRTGQAWLGARLAAALEAVVDAEVRIGRVDGTILGRVGLSDIEIVQNGVRVIAIDRVGARWALLPALAGHPLRVHSVTIERPEIRAVETRQGWNLATLTRPTDPDDAPSAFALAIDDLRIRDGVLRIRRADDRWHVRGLELHGRASVGPDGERLVVDRLALALADRGLAVAATGTVAHASTGELGLRGALRTARSRVRWEATVHDESYDIRLAAPRLAAADLAALGADAPRVDLAVRARVHGPVDALAVRARVGSEAGEATVRGTLALASAPAYDVAATFSGLDLAALAGGPRSVLTGTLRADGSGIELAATQGAATLTLRDSALGGTTVRALTLDAAAAAAGTITLTGEVDAAGGTSTLRAEVRDADRYEAEMTTRVADLGALVGRADLAGAITAHTRIRGRRLAAGRTSATVTLEAEGRDLRAGTRRALAATASARGRVGLEPGRARIELDALELQTDPHALALEHEATIEATADGVTIDELVLATSIGRARVRGRAGIRGANDLAIAIDGAELAALAGVLPSGLEGTAAGTIRVEGTAAAPRVEARLAIDRPVAAGVAFERADATLSLRDDRAMLDARVQRRGAPRLVLDATAPVRLALAPFALDVDDIRGRLVARDLELAAVGPFLPQLTKLGGRFDADVTIAGPATAPQVRGTARIAEGRAHVAALGVTYEAVEVAARFEDDRIFLEDLRAASGAGTLRGDGSLDLGSGDPEGALRAELTSFPLIATAEGEAAVTGWVWLTGSPAAPMIGGALETAGVTLRLPEEAVTRVGAPDPTITVVRSADGAPPLGDVPSAEPEAPRASGADAPNVFDAAAMEIQIAVPRNAWLKRSDAEIELRGWATVWKKPGDAPRVAAEIDAVRGWYSFRGKRFSLREGRVTLDGHEVDPILDIVAVHRARDYEVFVVVGGRLSEPTLRLESEPPLEQADVLAVLLFGRPSSELAGQETEALQAETVAIASGYAAQGLSQSVAGSLGLDSLQVDRVPGEDGVDETEITAGKYVTEDVFVSLSHRFGRETVDELRIEYQFLPGWSIDTSTDTLGQSGVDVFWKRRY